MQIKLFLISISEYETRNEELNKFLRSKKVLTAEQVFVQNAQFCGWAFTVHYLDQSAAQAAGSVKEKVDYRTVLDEATFEKFAKLREIRKRFAEAEAVPAYAVFTNEELAEIAKLPELTEQTIRTISGIGEKKVEKYGQKLIDEIRRDMPF